MTHHFIFCATLVSFQACSLFAAPVLTEAFFEQHCYECHDPDTEKGGLDLTLLSPGFSDRDTFATWIKVHDAIRKGEMPPQKKPRPDPADQVAVTQWLDQELFAADSRRLEEEGRIRLRRMTRSEFENSLKDLLDLPRLDIQGMLPRDGKVAGYEKIAEGLDLSPAHLSGYKDAIEHALTKAIATRSMPPPISKKRIYPAGLFKWDAGMWRGDFVLLKDFQPDPLLPLRGGYDEKPGYISDKNESDDLPMRRELMTGRKTQASRSAVGLLEANIPGQEAAMNVAPIYAGPYHLKMSIWGFHWNQGKVEPSPSPGAAVLRAHAEGKQQEGGRLLQEFTASSLQPEEHELTTWLEALESVVFDPVSIPNRGLRVRQLGGRAPKHVGPGVALDWFEFEGPVFDSWPPGSHRRLFGDLPITSLPEHSEVIPPVRQEVRGLPGYLPNYNRDLPGHEKTRPLETVQSAQPMKDAHDLISQFLPKAFRRPVTVDEIKPYVALVGKRLSAKACFEDAMRRAYVAILTSPEFLFHSSSRNAGSHALASRLSYWLWNGPPDSELLEHAEKGTLSKPEVLRSQIDRLLADHRSERFIEDFTDQWLELDRINETTPDKKLYPEYSFLLHEGMVAETREFVREAIRENLPARNLVDSDFTILTQRLAEHYGIEGVAGVEPRRVPIPPESPRGGLLTQASILKLTANGTTTSPVTRGVWVMDRLLNDPAPPPPPGISAIEPDTRGATTVREQLDLHRNDTSCAACHAKIDPAGFALESFDPVGGFRERYRSSGPGKIPLEKGQTSWKVNYRLGPPVDSSGALADGREFAGIDQLRQHLVDDEAALARAFVAHLSRYASGADLSYADRRIVNRIVSSAETDNYGLRSLLYALAESPLFLNP